MCLAVPGKITQIGSGNLATVEIFGITREVSLDLLPQAQLGDYVLVHAGFGIEIIPEESVEETLQLIREMAEATGMSLEYAEDVEGVESAQPGKVAEDAEAAKAAEDEGEA